MAGPQAYLDNPEGGQTNVKMDRKPLHCTGLRPLLGPMPKNKAVYTTASVAYGSAGAITVKLPFGVSTA